MTQVLALEYAWFMLTAKFNFRAFDPPVARRSKIYNCLYLYFDTASLIMFEEVFKIFKVSNLIVLYIQFTPGSFTTHFESLWVKRADYVMT